MEKYNSSINGWSASGMCFNGSGLFSGAGSSISKAPRPKVNGKAQKFNTHQIRFEKIVSSYIKLDVCTTFIERY